MYKRRELGLRWLKSTAQASLPALPQGHRVQLTETARTQELCRLLCGILMRFNAALVQYGGWEGAQQPPSISVSSASYHSCLAHGLRRATKRFTFTVLPMVSWRQDARPDGVTLDSIGKGCRVSPKPAWLASPSRAFLAHLLTRLPNGSHTRMWWVVEAGWGRTCLHAECEAPPSEL